VRFFLMGLYTKILCAFLSSPTYATRPSHLILYFLNSARCTVQVLTGVGGWGGLQKGMDMAVSCVTVQNTR
jgi:hypothetical protein